jgi:ABC-type thiamine transport system substrate-binding protein
MPSRHSRLRATLRQQDAIDPLLGARYRNILFGVIYNKNEIKGSAPKTLEDIVKPESSKNLIKVAMPIASTAGLSWA